MGRRKQQVSRRLLGWCFLLIAAVLPAELPAAACPAAETSAGMQMSAHELGAGDSHSAMHSCFDSCEEDGSGMADCTLACAPGTVALASADAPYGRSAVMIDRTGLPAASYHAPPDRIVPPPPRIGG